ncbi:aldo/keto reductase [Dactylosporangium fulvum]|uniref:Aldo/keto reductase n=1 Tax=Dactylosporangium fulvum TaxID=53359 RepID=A0ABY5VR33_9ACTN|nr:aldo/keto reductase [Dactylosporangium fulvum]UWP80238.1 aldo/keto reductase [Dactylosporangium fulvum]
MRLVPLGRTGLKVSQLCLGTLTFGLQCDEKQSHHILDKAVEGGINFIDTANVYPLGRDMGLSGRGRTEEIIGTWLPGRRDEVVLATKCSSDIGPLPWQQGSSRRSIRTAVEGSLRRLQTDYVDVLQLHRPDPDTPIDETLEALDALVRAGKVLYVGCSNFYAYQVARAIGRSEVRDLVRLDTVQPRYNLLFRQVERELFPLCAQEEVAVIPYNPLAGGLLSGKHSREQATEGSRFTLGKVGAGYRDRYWHEREFATIDALRPVAADAGLSLSTMAIAWVMHNPVVCAPIVGVSRIEQLTDVLAAIDVVLDPELLKRLDDLTREYRRGDDAR